MPPAEVSVEQRENWLSLLYHVSNIHSWDNTTIFKKCANKKLPSISRSTEFKGECKFLCRVLCFFLLLLKTENITSLQLNLLSFMFKMVQK